MTIGVQTAMAEARAVQRTDPKAESPAGVIYQIPLDSARRDAAPVLPTGKREDGTGGGAGGSGGGSGGQAGSPGASGGGGANGSGGGASGGAGGSSAGTGGQRGGNGAALSASGSASEGGGTPQDPSSIHSENGFGSSSQVPGVSQAALRTGAGVAAAQAAGSTLPTYLLIVLIALAAIGMGVLATRDSSLRGGSRPPTGL